MTDDTTICLWVFPVDDFADWCELVGNDREIETHADYMSMIAALQADQERQGRTVKRVHFSVAEMRAEMEKRGWANTPDNRAAVTGLRGAR